MLFNPRYGRLGMVAFPLLALEDLIGPVVELLGYVLIAIGLVLGFPDPAMAVFYFLLTCVFRRADQRRGAADRGVPAAPGLCRARSGLAAGCWLRRSWRTRLLPAHPVLPAAGAQAFSPGEKRMGRGAARRLGGTPGAAPSRPAGKRREANLSIEHRRSPGEPPAA